MALTPRRVFQPFGNFVLLELALVNKEKINPQIRLHECYGREMEALLQKAEQREKYIQQQAIEYAKNNQVDDENPNPYVNPQGKGMGVWASTSKALVRIYIRAWKEECSVEETSQQATFMAILEKQKQSPIYPLSQIPSSSSSSSSSSPPVLSVPFENTQTATTSSVTITEITDSLEKKTPQMEAEAKTKSPQHVQCHSEPNFEFEFQSQDTGSLSPTPSLTLTRPPRSSSAASGVSSGYQSSTTSDKKKRKKETFSDQESMHLYVQKFQNQPESHIQVAADQNLFQTENMNMKDDLDDDQVRERRKKSRSDKPASQSQSLHAKANENRKQGPSKVQVQKSQQQQQQQVGATSIKEAGKVRNTIEIERHERMIQKKSDSAFDDSFSSTNSDGSLSSLSVSKLVQVETKATKTENKKAKKGRKKNVSSDALNTTDRKRTDKSLESEKKTKPIEKQQHTKTKATSMYEQLAERTPPFEKQKPETKESKGSMNKVASESAADSKIKKGGKIKPKNEKKNATSSTLSKKNYRTSPVPSFSLQHPQNTATATATATAVPLEKEKRETRSPAVGSELDFEGIKKKKDHQSEDTIEKTDPELEKDENENNEDVAVDLIFESIQKDTAVAFNQELPLKVAPNSSSLGKKASISSFSKEVENLPAVATLQQKAQFQEKQILTLQSENAQIGRSILQMEQEKKQFLEEQQALRKQEIENFLEQQRILLESRQKEETQRVEQKQKEWEKIQEYKEHEFKEIKSTLQSELDLLKKNLSAQENETKQAQKQAAMEEKRAKDREKELNEQQEKEKKAFQLQLQLFMKTQEEENKKIIFQQKAIVEDLSQKLLKMERQQELKKKDEEEKWKKMEEKEAEIFLLHQQKALENQRTVKTQAKDPPPKGETNIEEEEEEGEDELSESDDEESKILKQEAQILVERKKNSEQKIETTQEGQGSQVSSRKKREEKHVFLATAKQEELPVSNLPSEQTKQSPEIQKLQKEIEDLKQEMKINFLSFQREKKQEEKHTISAQRPKSFAEKSRHQRPSTVKPTSSNSFRFRTQAPNGKFKQGTQAKQQQQQEQQQQQQPNPHGRNRQKQQKMTEEEQLASQLEKRLFVRLEKRFERHKYVMPKGLTLAEAEESERAVVLSRMHTETKIEDWINAHENMIMIGAEFVDFCTTQACGQSNHWFEGAPDALQAAIKKGKFRSSLRKMFRSDVSPMICDPKYNIVMECLRVGMKVVRCKSHGSIVKMLGGVVRTVATNFRNPDKRKDFWQNILGTGDSLISGLKLLFQKEEEEDPVPSLEQVVKNDEELKAMISARKKEFSVRSREVDKIQNHPFESYNNPFLNCTNLDANMLIRRHRESLRQNYKGPTAEAVLSERLKTEKLQAQQNMRFLAQKEKERQENQEKQRRQEQEEKKEKEKEKEKEKSQNLPIQKREDEYESENEEENEDEDKPEIISQPVKGQKNSTFSSSSSPSSILSVSSSSSILSVSSSSILSVSSSILSVSSFSPVRDENTQKIKSHSKNKEKKISSNQMTLETFEDGKHDAAGDKILRLIQESEEDTTANFSSSSPFVLPQIGHSFEKVAHLVGSLVNGSSRQKSLKASQVKESLKLKKKMLSQGQKEIYGGVY